MRINREGLPLTRPPSSHLCPENVGNLGSEEINPHHVYLRYHREPSTRSSSIILTPCVGWFCSFGGDYRKGHLEQWRFVVFSLGTYKFSKASITVDPRLPPEYSYCEIIISSVGKLWVLPYICIISYQLRACRRPLRTVSNSYDGYAK